VLDGRQTKRDVAGSLSPKFGPSPKWLHSRSCFALGVADVGQIAKTLLFASSARIHRAWADVRLRGRKLRLRPHIQPSAPR
jgi:hypothetical protein